MLKALPATPEAASPDGQPRRLPIGAEILPAGGGHFRVWAPRRQRVELVALGKGAGDSCELAAEGNGYYSAEFPDAAVGTQYAFRLDGDPRLFPDPASRFQPEGPLGPSQLVDPATFAWKDADWPGATIDGQVIYEMQIGTFTKEGTWQAAQRQLAELAELGFTLIELMPVAEFSGTRGWSYDGVNLFAPTHLYGSPDDFRSFVNEAHRRGIGVVLDVVYNHVGTTGNTLAQFAPEYFSDRYQNEWGPAMNFDGPNAEGVREFVLANAQYWIQEFHLDGFRIDATQAFYDRSEEHILSAIVRASRKAGAPHPVIIIGESEPQNVALVHPTKRGGFGMDALWNDDFHHAAIVRLTGRREAYYTDYLGTSEEFVAALQWGFLYQGQWYTWQNQRRGRPALDLRPETFVNYLQNHDQLANSARGERLHQLTSPGRYRVMTALFLLAPQTPLVFQGQEFGAQTPFLYFNDGESEPGGKVAAGRKRFLRQFRSLGLEEVQVRLADPRDPQTFERSKLDFNDRARHGEIYQLHRDLLRLRREIGPWRRCPDRMRCATLGADALVVRYFGDDDWLLLVNFGRELEYSPCPQPLLAPPESGSWQVRWSSEDPKYGGSGTPRLETERGWRIPAEAAVVLRSKKVPNVDFSSE